MKPIYISTDTEFTDDNILRGQVMQAAFVEVGSGKSGNWILPVSTNAQVMKWTWEHHVELLQAGLRMRLATSHLPKVKIQGTETWVAGSLVGQIYSMHDWLRARQQDAAAKNNTNEDDANEDYPLVMVTWNGTYDFAYTAKLFNLVGFVSPFHHRMVDVSNLAMALFPDLPWGFHSYEVREMVGLPPLPPEEQHKALYDARGLVEVYCRLNEIADARSRASRMLVEAYDQGEKEGGSVRWEHLDAAHSWAKLAEDGGKPS